MASVFVIGAAKVPEQREEEFVTKIGHAVTTGLGLPENLKSIYYQPIALSRATHSDPGDLTFFVYTAPDKTTEQKRALVKNIQEAVDDFFGADSGVRSVVIIKIHTDENVGVKGVLRLDAKKQG